MPDFNSLSPSSLLVGVVVGFLLTVVTIVLTETVFDRPRKQAKTVEDKPYFDPKKTLENAAKLPAPAQVKTASVTVRAGVPPKLVSIGATLKKVEPTPAHALDSVPLRQAVKRQSQKAAAARSSYRYTVVGRPETFDSLKAILAAGFPGILVELAGKPLFWDKLPQDVRDAIKREKVA